MDKQSPTLIHIINASLLFALAFNLTYFLHELGLALAGAYWGNTPVLYHNNMSYLNMARPEQILAFAFGPLAVLCAGLLCWGALGFLQRGPAWLKLLLLWMGFHGLFIFLIQMPGIAFDAHTTDLTKAFHRKRD